MVIYKHSNKLIYSSTNESVKYSSAKIAIALYTVALVPCEASLIAILGYSIDKPLIGLK